MPRQTICRLLRQVVRANLVGLSAWVLTATTAAAAPLATVDVSNVKVTRQFWLEGAYNVRFAAGGHKLLYCRRNDGVYLADRDGSRAHRLAAGAWFEAMAPDGQTAWLSDPEKGVCAVNLGDEQARRVATTPYGRLNVSPNGRLAVGHPNFKRVEQVKAVVPTGEPVLLDLSNGQRLPTPEWSQPMAWSADGNCLLWQKGEYSCVTNATGQQQKPPPRVGLLLRAGWLGRTHELLAVSWDAQPALLRFNADTGTVSPFTTPAGPVALRGGTEVRVSAGGGWLAISGADTKTTRLVRLADGREWTVPERIFALLALPQDVGWLGFPTRFYDAADPGQPRQLPNHDAYRSAVRPDGLAIAYPAEGDRLGLCRCDGQQAHDLATGVPRPGLCNWAGDGRGLILEYRHDGFRGLPPRALVLWLSGG